jgi:thioredoxin reductase (NADPH)
MAADDPLHPRLRAPSSDSNEAFPQLTVDQMAVLMRWGQRRSAVAGDVLFRAGDVVTDVFVVQTGRVAMLRQDPDAERVAQVHGERQLLGELGTLEGQPAMFSARVLDAGELVVVPVRHLKDVALQDSVLGETILRAYLIRRADLIDAGTGMRIVGSCYSADTRRLLDFSTRNRLPHRWIDVEKAPEVDAFLQRMNVAPEDTPVVVLANGNILKNPSTAALADELHLRASLPDSRGCDLLVVGAGPAGLAASVYGASDGLDVTTVDAVAVGGQASTTSRIENYIGFPAGISGAELTERAAVQARRFGARLVVPAHLVTLENAGDHFRATFDGHDDVNARTVLAASGARYRRLDVPGLDRFETANVHYEATITERQACGADPVAVIGGGNSAGQAAVFLAHTTPKVYLIVRDHDLGAKMSRYLVDQIGDNSRVVVMTDTEVHELLGDGQYLTSIAVRNDATGARQTLAVRTLFVFIGAQPQTAWLSGLAELDTHGFIYTGADLQSVAAPGSGWGSEDRARSILETSVPGLFAAGDVRSGATRRVAAAMGDGAIAVALAGQYLASTGRTGFA